MEGHTAIPDRKDFCRIGEILGGLVKDHVSQASTQDDTQDEPGQHLFGLGRVHDRFVIGPKAGCLDRHDGKAPADDDAHDIGHRVPAQGEFAVEQRNREDLGRDVGEGDHERGHLRLNASACCGLSTLRRVPLRPI